MKNNKKKSKKKASPLKSKTSSKSPAFPKNVPSDLVATRTENDQSIQLKFSPKLKDLWIKNLKSKKFKKGTEILCGRNPENTEECSYCPLGVLVETLIEHRFPIKKSKTTKDYAYWNPVAFTETKIYSYTYKGKSGIQLLPSNLAKLIGISSDAQEAIAIINDQNPHDKSFKKTIKAIEKEIDLDILIEKE